MVSAEILVDSVLSDFGITPVYNPHGDTRIAWLPDDPVEWIEREFWIPETNSAIVLQDYQRKVVKEALRRDDNGLFVYSLVLWSDIKKSAKSTITAAMCLWLAWHHSWESVRIAANDLNQASSRTFFYIERALKLNTNFAPHFTSKTYHIRLDNQTTIDAIPLDAKGEAGGGDLAICFTELWAAKNKAAQLLWSETTLSPLKYGRSIRFAESYAGYIGESPILEQLYETGVNQGRRIDEDLELYVNEPARLLALWNTRPRCEWQTSDYYAQESATLTPQEFDRLHRNQWAMASNPFVPIEWWDSAKVDQLPEMSRHQPVVIGIDAGISNDCFAIVAVSRAGDQLAVRHVSIWHPENGKKIDFAEPEAELRRLANTFNVVEFAYDSYQLYDMATRLQKEGVGFFRPFPQGADRLKSDKGLYDRIRDRRIMHTGEPDLRLHIMNASAKPEGDKMRIIKKSESSHIDAAVCMAMACHRASYLNIG